ncbi:Phosphatase family protein [Mycetohabitans rhizoxinica HKI 454]|uniref:Phosphatase family protein n=1 Tax=Mycetohabitans rhizoxinica (strain DSM 19002 / CIP 109453 / HKI 454) TaxID=882378 RepID=E5AL38_MYCRK|nr:Phosphatase family protein [Mycetohabitans rhizoxinica HKI 454]
MDPDPGQPRGNRTAEPGGLPRRDREQPVGHRPRPVRHGHAQRDTREDAPQSGGAGRGRVDAIFFCPHTPTDHCDCRKPKPGLLAQIIRRFEIDAASTPVVGDSLRDLQAGAALGFSCHLVLTGKGQQTLDAGHLPAGTTVYADLHAFALDFLAAEAN